MALQQQLFFAVFSKSRPMRSLISFRCSFRGPRKGYLPPFLVEPPFCCFQAPATFTYLGSLPQGSQRSCPTFSVSPTLVVLPCPPLPILTSRASARNRVGELQGMRLQRSAMSLLNSLSCARKSSLLSFAQFLDTFNNSALFAAIPPISAAIGISNADSVWLISAYQLTFAAFLLVVSVD